jgi:hypothetical protein
MIEETPYRAYCKFCEWISNYETLADAKTQAVLHKADNKDLRCSPQTEPVPKDNERKTCERCGRQKPAGIAENGAAPEGWGEWLCWGDPIDCDKHRTKTRKLQLNIELSFDEAKQIEDCLRWAADSALIDPAIKSTFDHVVDCIRVQRGFAQ